MVALKIAELKDFTRKLFVEEVFDWWMMREAVITTFNMFTIDGRIRKGYFMEQELEEKGIGELSPWKLVRPVCFSLIKGKRLPESFRITLQLPGARVEQFLQSVQPDFKAEQVSGLYLNIRYEEQKLYCVTGTSLNVFTLDRKIEQEWDETVKRFLRKREIVYTEG